jgi:hypothetical protein
MKRIFLVALIGVFLVGCAGIQLSGDVQAVAIKDAAMIAGYKLAQARPEVVRAARPYAAAMLEAANSGRVDRLLWSQGVMLLQERINDDPLLMALITDAVSLIVISDAQIDKATQGQITAALGGFVMGIDLAQR